MLDKAHPKTHLPWWRGPWIAAAVLFALTLAVYSPAISGQVLWDDAGWMWGNPVTVANDGILRLWHDEQSPDYWPITSSLFWVQYRLWGRNLAGYHVVSIVLHAGGAVLLWRVLRRLVLPGAYLAAVVFAVHPVTAASVAWISETKNTLSLVFFTLAILLYLRFDDGQGRRWYWLSLGAHLFALLTKTSTVMLPIVLLGLAWWRRGRVRAKDLLAAVPFLALSAVFGAITIWFHENRAIGQEDVGAPPEMVSRLLIAGKALWFYLYTALAPVRLSMIYPRWDASDRSLLSVLSAVLAVAAATTIWLFRRRWGRAPALGLGYFAVTLLPVLGLQRMSFTRFSFVGDHLAYLALPGVIALVVGMGWHFVVRLSGGRRWFAAALAVAAVAAPAALTCHRAWLMADPVRLWEDTVRKSPRAWAAHNNLGAVLSDLGRYEQAIKHFRTALALKADYSDAHDNLGMALECTDKVDEAIPHYRQACLLAPRAADIRHRLGKALQRTGQTEQAAECFRQALEIDPGHARAHFELGLMDASQQRPREAKAHYRAALQAQPKWPPAMKNLAWALASDEDATPSDQAEALGLIERLRHLEPPSWQPLLTLATALAATGRGEQAAQTSEQAAKLADAAGTKDKAATLRDFALACRRGLTYRDFIRARTPAAPASPPRDGASMNR